MTRQRPTNLKTKLPELYHRRLEQNRYFLDVKVSISANSDNIDGHTIGHAWNGQILFNFFTEQDNELEAVEIGRILAWRICSSSIDEILFWADTINQSLHDASQWLSLTTTIELDDVLVLPILFIQEVEIEPVWRGQGLTLPAVATFLDLACRDFVFFMPNLIDADQLPRREREQKIRQLRRYWQRLGFQHYDAAHNVMWEPCWSRPEWLRVEY